VLELALTLAALAISLRARLATIGEAAIAAGLCVFVPLLLARWTTQSYYVYAATLALTGLAVLHVTAGSSNYTRKVPADTSNGRVTPP